MWYYTAAFIEDLDGHPVEASKLLAKAEQSHGTEFIKESVKVMRIYLDAKLMPYNQGYENLLFKQLQWLDQKIADNITLRCVNEPPNIMIWRAISVTIIGMI